MDQSEYWKKKPQFRDLHAICDEKSLPNWIRLPLGIATGILVFLTASASFAQELNMPYEIDRIMKASNISYENNVLGKKLIPESWNLINPIIIKEPIRKNKQVSIPNRVSSSKKRSLFETAKIQYTTGQYKRSYRNALESLNEEKERYKVFDLLGSISLIEGNEEQAIAWFDKAIADNAYDYYAYWKLAELDYGKGDLEKAVYQAMKAHFLNRNNPEILELVSQLLEEQGSALRSWNFNPQFYLEQGEGGSISINANEKPWIYYGKCKALWQYEPAYRQGKMQDSDISGLVEEKEGVLNAMIGFNQLNNALTHNRFPELVAFERAITQQLADEYILYEIILVKNPVKAYSLQEQDFINLMEFIKSIKVSTP